VHRTTRKYKINLIAGLITDLKVFQESKPASDKDFTLQTDSEEEIMSAQK